MRRSLWYSTNRSTQTVEAFGNRLARMTGERLGARIDLDARHGAGRGDDLDQGRAVLRFLAWMVSSNRITPEMLSSIAGVRNMNSQ